MICVLPASKSLWLNQDSDSQPGVLVPKGYFGSCQGVCGNIVVANVIKLNL